MKVIKILLGYEGQDPNGSKKILKTSVQVFTLKPHSQPGLPVNEEQGAVVSRLRDVMSMKKFIEVPSLKSRRTGSDGSGEAR